MQFLAWAVTVSGLGRLDSMYEQDTDGGEATKPVHTVSRGVRLIIKIEVFQPLLKITHNNLPLVQVLYYPWGDQHNQFRSVLVIAS